MAKQSDAKATAQEEAVEQAFLIKQTATPESEQPEQQEELAPQGETVPGYSGSPHEGKGPPNTVPEGVHPDTVASDTGVTPPPGVFLGDGITPERPVEPPPDMHPPGEEGRTYGR